MLTWASLKDVVSERSQTRKATECVIPCIQIWQTLKDRKEVSGCQRLGGEEGGMTSDFLVNKDFFGVIKMF